MCRSGDVVPFDRGGDRSRRLRSLATGALLLFALGTDPAVYGQEPQAGGEGNAARPEQAAAGEPELDPGSATTFLSGGVYLLCAATSCICAALLLRGYSQNRVRLLFWSGLCFVGLAVDNVMLYVDLVIVPEVNIAIWRRLPGLVAMLLLTYGLVWDSK